MLTCPSCGHQNPDGSRFCNSCATPLEPQAPALREERKVVTVMFADIVGFTARTERMDPEEVRTLLRSYYTRLSAILESHGGTIEKFIGDAVMTLFGAPVAHEDDPERAVRAALAIQESLGHDGELQVRVGITTGEILVTLSGGPDAGGGTASGDVVNTAARLQTAAPAGGILVDETTYRATERSIEYADASQITAKGKADPVRVWQPYRVGRTVPSHGVPTLLVGRTEELTLLRHTLTRVKRQREPQLVTLVGVPGIGKTRLISELLQEGSHDPEPVLWRTGHSLSYGEGVSFWALSEIVKAQAELTETDPSGGASEKLHAVVGKLIAGATEAAWVERHLRPLIGLETDELGTGDRRSEAFAAWRRFLEAIAEEHPLVLVFEDLHWADDALLDFIEHLVGWASGVPMLVLATTRPELFARRAGWGAGRGNSASILLPPLSNDETAILVDALLGPSNLAGGEQHHLIERAGGNPLYAEEFVRMMNERRGTAALPESVQGLVAARLDALPLEEKQLLQDAAVMGLDFFVGALGTDSYMVDQQLHELERKEFVRSERRSSIAGEAEYSFRHTLIREVAYEQIPKWQRADKHQAAAAWLASQARREENAEMLAYHYLKAVEYGRAVGHVPENLITSAIAALQLAGDRALSLHVYPAAIRFYDQALSMATNGDEQIRCDLLLSRGDAHARGGSPAEAMESFLTAAELARRTNSPERLARAALGYGGRFVWSRAWGDEHLVGLLDEALSGLPDEDSDLRVRLQARLAAGPLRDTVPVAPREAMSEAALEMARRLGEPATLAYALEGRHGANLGPDSLARRLTIANELIEVSKDTSDTEREYAGYEYRFHALLESGGVPEARLAFEDMTRLARELAQPAQLWFTAVNRAKLALFEGRFDEAETALVEELELGRHVQTANPQMAFDLQQYALRREQGRLPELVDVVARAVDDYPSYPVWRYVYADVLAQLGRETEARSWFDKLATQGFPLYLEMQWLFGMNLLPDVCRYLDDHERAARLYRLLAPYAQLNATLPPELCGGSVSRGLGILASMMSKWDDAERHFQLALANNAKMGARAWLAHTQYDYGLMLRSRGVSNDYQHASELFNLTSDAAHELGMNALAKRADATLEVAG